MKKIKNILASKNGSAIIWAFAFLSIISIVLTAVLSIAQSYSARSIYNKDDQQALVTARSVVSMITSQFTSHSDKHEEIYKVLKTNNNVDKTWTSADPLFIVEGDHSAGLAMQQQDIRLTMKLIEVDGSPDYSKTNYYDNIIPTPYGKKTRLVIEVTVEDIVITTTLQAIYAGTIELVSASKTITGIEPPAETAPPTDPGYNLQWVITSYKTVGI